MAAKLSSGALRWSTWMVKLTSDFSPGRMRPEVGEMVSHGGARVVEPGLRTKDHWAMTCGHDVVSEERHQVCREGTQRTLPLLCTSTDLVCGLRYEMTPKSRAGDGMILTLGRLSFS